MGPDRLETPAAILATHAMQRAVLAMQARHAPRAVLAVQAMNKAVLAMQAAHAPRAVLAMQVMNKAVLAMQATQAPRAWTAHGLIIVRAQPAGKAAWPGWLASQSLKGSKFRTLRFLLPHPNQKAMTEK